MNNFGNNDSSCLCMASQDELGLNTGFWIKNTTIDGSSYNSLDSSEPSLWCKGIHDRSLNEGFWTETPITNGSSVNNSSDSTISSIHYETYESQNNDSSMWCKGIHDRSLNEGLWEESFSQDGRSLDNNEITKDDRSAINNSYRNDSRLLELDENINIQPVNQRLIDISGYDLPVNVSYRRPITVKPTSIVNGSVPDLIDFTEDDLYEQVQISNLPVRSVSKPREARAIVEIYDRVREGLSNIQNNPSNAIKFPNRSCPKIIVSPLDNSIRNTSNLSKIAGFDRSTQKAKLNVSSPIRTRYIPIEIPDDDVAETSNRSKDATRSSNLSNKPPDVTPVNSLRNKFLLRAEFQEGWLSNISKKYDVKEQQRNEDIIQQTESLQDLTHNTRQTELDIQKKLQDVCIASDIIQIDDSSESEVEVCEFPELSNDDKKIIEHASRNGPGQDVIIAKFNLQITRHDLGTLVGLNWLNDEVINFYMNLLNERSEQLKDCGYPAVYSMNTFFVPRLMQSGHAGVRRWTRKVNIFSYDIIPVPVHVGQVHWCMAIIHLKEKTIKYYDSMGTPNPAVLRSLETYLKDESMDKRKTNLSMNDWEIESVRNLPRQMNGSDCGVFSCMFAEYITRNKPITFSQENMVYFRQKMILEIAKGKLLT